MQGSKFINVCFTLHENVIIFDKSRILFIWRLVFCNRSYNGGWRLSYPINTQVLRTLILMIIIATCYAIKHTVMSKLRIYTTKLTLIFLFISNANWSLLLILWLLLFHNFFCFYCHQYDLSLHYPAVNISCNECKLKVSVRCSWLQALEASRGRWWVFRSPRTRGYAQKYNCKILTTLMLLTIFTLS